MTPGPCTFGCGFQANLEGHYSSYHHMVIPLPSISEQPRAVSSPPTASMQFPQSNAPHPADDINQYCPTCGKKRSAQTWKEVVIAFVRYQMMVFWIGSFVGSLFGFEIAARIFGH